jgi:PIN domain nuclease of toxin-antitoxin system
MVWFWLHDAQLSNAAEAAISDPVNQILVSPASYWELAIKISLGKYQLPVAYEPFFQQQITQNDFEILPIQINHTATLIDMPFHHRDPFDRLLVAQAAAEDVPLVSADAALDAYGIKRLW